MHVENDRGAGDGPADRRRELREIVDMDDVWIEDADPAESRPKILPGIEGMSEQRPVWRGDARPEARRLRPEAQRRARNQIEPSPLAGRPGGRAPATARHDGAIGRQPPRYLVRPETDRGLLRRKH